MDAASDLEQATRAQQRNWSAGDFALVAGLVNPVSEALATALEILPDERVLDVACGSGNFALAAARRAWGNTVGCDFVPALLERGRLRAEAELLDVEFVEADAQDLPFGDASFDVVGSVFGAMFAPDQPRTAAELLRVTRSGGRIGMANWVPDGEVGEMFATVARHTGGPPPGVDPPPLWGSEERLRELFGDGISALRVERRRSRQCFRSPQHYIEFFSTYMGPVKLAFEQLGPEGSEALAADLREMLGRANRGGERALVLEPEYLLVLAERA